MERTILTRVPIDETIDLVLCETNDSYTPFVTWIYNKSDKGYHLGHYHRDKQMARNDFLLRVIKYTLRSRT